MDSLRVDHHMFAKDPVELILQSHSNLKHPLPWGNQFNCVKLWLLIWTLEEDASTVSGEAKKALQCLVDRISLHRRSGTTWRRSTCGSQRIQVAQVEGKGWLWDEVGGCIGVNIYLSEAMFCWARASIPLKPVDFFPSPISSNSFHSL